MPYGDIEAAAGAVPVTAPIDLNRRSVLCVTDDHLVTATLRPPGHRRPRHIDPRRLGSNCAPATIHMQPALQFSVLSLCNATPGYSVIENYNAGPGDRLARSAPH
jgi:hypothetical protein